MRYVADGDYELEEMKALANLNNPGNMDWAIVEIEL